MPIYIHDPWRVQYFINTHCPENVHIPVDDDDAWRLNPKYRWIYNKLEIALSQGLQAEPHGIFPSQFPVFSKPMINLRGMGVGSRIIATSEEYDRFYTPGHMWMTLLEGPHVSSDVVVVQGQAQWWCHVSGRPGFNGTFDYWTIHADANPVIEEYCGAWIAQHLSEYTGILNFETIGGKIIEAHLRFSDQWPDLYGEGWVDALIALYRDGEWSFENNRHNERYSVVLFGPNKQQYHHPDTTIVESILSQSEVSSVQITFHEGRDAARHAMPPGGFRLAIINCHDLSVGMAARKRLANAFGVS